MAELALRFVDGMTAPSLISTSYHASTVHVLLCSRVCPCSIISNGNVVSQRQTIETYKSQRAYRERTHLLYTVRYLHAILYIVAGDVERLLGNQRRPAQSISIGLSEAPITGLCQLEQQAAQHERAQHRCIGIRRTGSSDSHRTQI